VLIVDRSLGIYRAELHALTEPASILRNAALLHLLVTDLLLALLLLLHVGRHGAARRESWAEDAGRGLRLLRRLFDVGIVFIATG
jgi:hypothetical protein